MAGIDSNSRVRRENQFAFINGQQIAGVQSIQGGYTNNAQNVKFLGMKSPVMAPRGPQIADFTISTLVIGLDVFLQYTGNSAFNGYILKNKSNPADNFSFTSGFLTSYRSTCSIGQIPRVDASISVLGNIGVISSGESPLTTGHFPQMLTGQLSQPINITSFGSIDLNLNDFNTNRVLSYDLTIKTDRNPIYGIGSAYPIRVELNPPVEVTAAFEIDVNDFTFRNLRKYPCDVKIQNFSMNLKDYISGTNILSYSFPNMFLLSESYNADVNGSVKGSLVYKTFINSRSRAYDADPYVPPSVATSPPISDQWQYSGVCKNGGDLYTGYFFNPATNRFIFKIREWGSVYLRCTGGSGMFFENLVWNGGYTGVSPVLQTELTPGTTGNFTVLLPYNNANYFCLVVPSGCQGTTTTSTTTPVSSEETTTSTTTSSSSTSTSTSSSSTSTSTSSSSTSTTPLPSSSPTH